MQVRLPVRLRKLIGSLALLVLLAAWIFVAMVVAYAVFRVENPYLAAAYYVIAGFGWVLPAMPLVSWMLRQDRPGVAD
jgi:hypothetical protein